jgi:hypothetical protein
MTMAQWIWRKLGQPEGAGGIAGPVGVTTVMDPPEGAQRPFVFVHCGDGNLYRMRPVSGQWEWGNEGQPTPAVFVEGPVGVTTVKDYPDAMQRPYAFVRGSDGNLWLNWWAYDHWEWSNQGNPPGLASIDGPVGVTTVMDSPQGAQCPYAFVRGSDGNLWVNSWHGTQWSWSNQGRPSIFVSVAGPVGVTTVKDYPAAEQRPYAFVRGSDGNLWLNWWAYDHWEWSDRGRPGGSPNLVVEEAVGVTTVMDGPQAAQRPYAFVRANDGCLWSHWWDGTRWNWTNQEEGGHATVFGVGVTTVKDFPDAAQRLYVFVRASDYQIWINWWSYDHWEWSDQHWPTGSGDATGGVGVTTVMDSPQAPQRPHAFILDGNGDLWLNYWE